MILDLPAALPNLFHEEGAEEELTVFRFIEPGALDVEELEAGDPARERKRVSAASQHRQGLLAGKKNKLSPLGRRHSGCADRTAGGWPRQGRVDA